MLQDKRFALLEYVKVKIFSVDFHGIEESHSVEDDTKVFLEFLVDNLPDVH